MTPPPLPQWSGDYPPRERLRTEVEAMAEAYLEAVEAVLPGVLEGAYLKGSTVKRWDTPLDYVPEVSDVDIHLLFHEDDESALDELDVALEVQAGADRRFAAAVPEPLHLPRPQLMNANRLHRERFYVAAPAAAVRVRFGPPYPAFPDDPAPVVAFDRERLLEVEGLVVAENAVDKPGPYLISAIRNVNWRVSPVAARVASVLSNDPERAWSLNRSGLVRWLADLGEPQLAADLVRYYLACWRHFRSDGRDGDSGREALLAADAIMRRGVGVGRR